MNPVSPPAGLRAGRARLAGALTCLWATCAAAAPPTVPAFPGAEGYGATATGGRGGRAIEVQNLHDAGPGSLREALAASGPRTVIFRVSGTIALQKRLTVTDDVTIAGQTAPGDGICLKNFGLPLSGVHNAIVRYLRCRPGSVEGMELDSLGGRDAENLIVDHCSASWSVDETLSIYRGKNITVQWCLISESLYRSVHAKGAHGYGGIWGGTNASWHHNLLAHHTSRNPRFARDEQPIDFRNNTIYNWGFNSAYGGEHGGVNLVANYFKPGPATLAKVRARILDASGEGGRWFIDGNVLEGAPDLDADNWQGGVQRPWTNEAGLRVNTSFPAAFVTTQPARQASEQVLRGAGATLPRRDAVDARIVEEVQAGTAQFGKSFAGGGNGIIDTPEDVGGWPELQSTPAPPDADHDGLPDEWEEKFHLDPHSADDGPKDRDSDGYTNLEEYLNGTNPAQAGGYLLAGELLPVTVRPRQPATFFRDEMTVAADGSGDFQTVQAAVDAAPSGRTRPFTIKIKPGNYTEHVVIPAEKPFLRFAGSEAESTVIADARTVGTLDASGQKIATQDSATLWVRGNDFGAQRVTIANTHGIGIQALAIFLEADRASFRDCQFLGWQDTVRLDNGRAYFRGCTIAGHVDYLYGSATALFERCEMHSLGDGCLVAPSTPQASAYGFVFLNCRVSAAPDVKRILLGRPWRPFGSAIFLQTELPAAIVPAGWDNWQKIENEKTARFAEYQSSGLGANPGARFGWARQLSAAEARAITVEAVLGGADAWNPAARAEPEKPNGNGEW